MNTKLHCGSFTRTTIRTVVGTGAVAPLLFFSASSAWATGEVMKGEPDPNGGYQVHVTGANSPGEQCDYALDPDPPQASKDAIAGKVDWDRMNSGGHETITVHCQHPVKDAKGNWAGWVDDSIQVIDIATGKAHDMTPAQPAQPPSAAPAAPNPPSAAPAPAVVPVAPTDAWLGKQWNLTDTGGDQTGNPWNGTWNRTNGNNWKWSETRLGVTVTGTAEITYDAAKNTVTITRHLDGGNQLCTYTGQPTGSSSNGLFTGLKGTVNCSNSGFANMPWWTNSIQ